MSDQNDVEHPTGYVDLTGDPVADVTGAENRGTVPPQSAPMPPAPAPNPTPASAPMPLPDGQPAGGTGAYAESAPLDETVAGEPPVAADTAILHIPVPTA